MGPAARTSADDRDRGCCRDCRGASRGVLRVHGRGCCRRHRCAEAGRRAAGVRRVRAGRRGARDLPLRERLPKRPPRARGGCRRWMIRVGSRGRGVGPVAVRRRRGTRRFGILRVGRGGCRGAHRDRRTAMVRRRPLMAARYRRARRRRRGGPCRRAVHAADGVSWGLRLGSSRLRSRSQPTVDGCLEPPRPRRVDDWAASSDTDSSPRGAWRGRDARSMLV